MYDWFPSEAFWEVIEYIDIGLSPNNWIRKNGQISHNSIKSRHPVPR